MKNFLIFTSLLFLSCSDDKDRISKVEEFLGTDLPTNYKMDYSEDMGLDMIDITLERDDFNEILKKIDTTKFKKWKTFYSKRMEGEGDDVTSILLSAKEYRIKYFEKW